MLIAHHIAYAVEPLVLISSPQVSLLTATNNECLCPVLSTYLVLTTNKFLPTVTTGPSSPHSGGSGGITNPVPIEEEEGLVKGIGPATLPRAYGSATTEYYVLAE